MKRLAEHDPAVLPMEAISALRQTDHPHPRIARHDLEEKVPSPVVRDEKRVCDECCPEIGDIGRLENGVADRRG
jgi:hypothetical protein